MRVISDVSPLESRVSYKPPQKKKYSRCSVVPPMLPMNAANLMLKYNAHAPYVLHVIRM
jgi:hypothetical protein